MDIWPAAGRIPGGGAPPPPEDIPDLEVRKKYVAAIEEQRRNVRINNERQNLGYQEENWARGAKYYIPIAYSKPPFATEEIEKTLNATDLDKKLKDKILAEVKKQVAAQTVLDTNRPPRVAPVMTMTERQPPGTEPHHPDPRLRKLLSFNLTSPLAEDMLATLRAATGIKLTRSPQIQNEFPSHGSVSFGGVPVWEVMDHLARSQFIEGRWEKDGDGYRLVRNAKEVHIPK